MQLFTLEITGTDLFSSPREILKLTSILGPNSRGSKLHHSAGREYVVEEESSAYILERVVR